MQNTGNECQPTLWVEVGLDVPQRVHEHGLLVARHFLLFKSPVRKLDLVREQVTAGLRVPQAEVSAQSPKTFARLLVALVTLDNFHDPIIVGVSSISRDAITGHFLLEVDVGHGRTDVMRMEGFLRLNVPDLNACARSDVVNIVVGPVSVRITISRCIHDAPIVVGVTVRIESYLLLCGQCQHNQSVNVARDRSTYACYRRGKYVGVNASNRLGCSHGGS